MEDIRHSKKITDLLRLLAFQIGSEVSISELGKSLAADFRTVQRYLDLLEKSFVIFRVGGFSRNLRKEVTKNDRYYFFDNGVRNALIQNFNGISLRNDVGMLWENYLMVERLKTNQRMHRFVNTYFWRTYDQKELDCVEEHEGKLFGYEFKFTNGNIRKTTRQEFLQSYPQSELTCISRENYEAFIS
jgi:predicted AAA+ superfamily ATPase